MMPLRRHILLSALKLFDLSIMAFSYLLAAGMLSPVSFPLSFERLLSFQVSIKEIIFFSSLLLAWHILFSLFGLYRSWRVSTRKREITDLLKADLLGTLTLCIAARLFNVSMATPLFLGVFWVTATIIGVLSRLLLRWGLGWIRVRGRNLRYVLIVGTDDRAVSLAHLIETKAKLGYCLSGFVNGNGERIRRVQEAGYPVVTDFKGFPSFVRDRVVDEVWIGRPRDVIEGELSRIVIFCRNCGIIIRYFSGSLDSIQALSENMSFEDDSVFTCYPGPVEANFLLGKRLMDILGSLALLGILSPLLVIGAILVKLTSPGPVFFVQERIGLNRRKFRLYKFRTMCQGAEQRLSELEHLNEISGPVFKMANDPRLTRIGKFLRKSSIDELPQLFNVLKGDMSLVGPRPLPVRDYNGFDEDWYRRRLCVLPGMTCLWQVNGRNVIPFEEWMGLDLKYIDQWSLRLDLHILLKTIPAVLKGSGAA
jgi:exopolysaccharide biosynthesis polyprenyl glycosylphosphotransferase